MQKPSYRIAQILVRLYNEEIVNKHDLAEEFGVNAKTIQRDINERLSKLPIIARRNGDYSLDKAYIKSNHEEIRKLIKIFDITMLPTRLSDEFLDTLFTQKELPITSVKNNEIDDISSVYESLTNAILNKVKIKITYNAKERTLMPYKLVNHQDIWYLLACEEAELKSFTLYKIKNLLITQEEFIPNESTQELINNNSSSFVSNNITNVILELDCIAKEYFLKRAILKNQRIISSHLDKIIIETETSYEDEIIRLVFKWIPHIKILEPKSLANECKARIKEYLKNI